ncbi:MAG: hypothetical protein ACFE75_08840 [Candidatus Hodarchaeota archaeon]
MEKKCENCISFRKLFGTEYCAYYDTPKNFWEGRKYKDEMICDKYFPKKASFEEQMKYIKKQREKQIKLDIWDDEEEDEYMTALSTPSERFRIKQEMKRGMAYKNKFIGKYPELNPSPP